MDLMFIFVLDSPVYIDLILSISAEKLEDILVHLDLHNCVKNLVNIFAPNLKYLKLSGDWPQFGEIYVFRESRVLFWNVIFFPSMAIVAVFYGDLPLLLENVCYLSIHVGSFNFVIC
ncbi:unnamed protein product [Prunus armeniaca]